ncbi:MAG: branched-chain amino acid ABC transporter permease, partial [Pseudomonadota bacterium]
SGVIAAAFGVLFGLPSLRVRGIYLMVATLASQFFIIWMIDKFGWFKNYDTSGIITAQDIVIFGKPFTTPMEMYLVVVLVVTVLTILALNMARGSIGRNWMAVRDMDIAAESMGISLYKTKLQAFAISAFFCGIAGALFAFTYLKSMEPVAFDIKLSFRILFMVILGGLGTISGCFIGAAFILLFPVVLNSVGNNLFHGAIDATIISSIELVVFGVLIIVFMIYEPLGMAKLWENTKQRVMASLRGRASQPTDRTT